VTECLEPRPLGGSKKEKGVGGLEKKQNQKKLPVRRQRRKNQNNLFIVADNDRKLRKREEGGIKGQK